METDPPGLERIVQNNAKMRDSFDAGHEIVHAGQGHTIHADLGLRPMRPPSALYHGTAARFLESMQREGIAK
jgi:putative RNA 2'-phosphotransferase